MEAYNCPKVTYPMVIPGWTILDYGDAVGDHETPSKLSSCWLARRLAGSQLVIFRENLEHQKKFNFSGNLLIRSDSKVYLRTVNI